MRVINAHRPDVLALQELDHLQRGQHRLLSRIQAPTATPTPTTSAAGASSGSHRLVAGRSFRSGL